VIRHVVLQRFAPGHDAAARAAVLAELDELITGLESRMPGLLAHMVGTDLGLTDGAADAALVIDAADVAAWRAYQLDPGHVDFVRNRLGPMLAERTVIQFEPVRP
jgi:hypothetical protein